MREEGEEAEETRNLVFTDKNVSKPPWLSDQRLGGVTEATFFFFFLEISIRAAGTGNGR